MNVHDYQRFSEEVWQRNFHDVDIEHLQEKSSIEREERDVNRKRGQAEKRYQGERWQRETLSREGVVKRRDVRRKRRQGERSVLRDRVTSGERVVKRNALL